LKKVAKFGVLFGLKKKKKGLKFWFRKWKKFGLKKNKSKFGQFVGWFKCRGISARIEGRKFG
jgi:hypothetical protein